MQQEVHFDPCRMTHSDFVACSSGLELLLPLVAAAILGLLATRPALRRVIGGGPGVSKLCIPQPWQKTYLAVLISGVATAGLWVACVKFGYLSSESILPGLVWLGEVTILLLLVFLYFVGPVIVSGLVGYILDGRIRSGIVRLAISGVVIAPVLSLILTGSISAHSFMVCVAIGIALVEVARVSHNATWATLRFVALPVGLIVALRMLVSGHP